METEMTDVPESSRTLPENLGIQEIRLGFTLQHWCLWQSKETPFGEFWPGGEVLPYNGGRADVSFLPMMQSRRLSPLARAVSAVAWHSLQQCGNMPSVFLSSHGESQYYFEMLQGMAGGEGVSPSRFSLCVHNAIAGLSSIHSASYLPYVSLAGGTEGLFAAFLEAGGILLETSKVLVVWYEQALPDAYQAYLTTSETTFALSMILTRGGGPGHQLRLARRPGKGGSNAEDCTTSLVQTILEGRRSAVCHLEQSIWQWSLDDA
jgi:hypothetical protein